MATSKLFVVESFQNSKWKQDEFVSRVQMYAYF